MKKGQYVYHQGDLFGVPFGLRGRIVRARHDVISVRWIWPAGTQLGSKPDTTDLSPAEAEIKLRL